MSKRTSYSDRGTPTLEIDGFGILSKNHMRQVYSSYFSVKTNIRIMNTIENIRALLFV